MKNVLFYGDSNTWGYQGDDPMHRLDADKRYTGVVAAQFPDVHFIEEGPVSYTHLSYYNLPLFYHSFVYLCTVIFISRQGFCLKRWPAAGFGSAFSQNFPVFSQNVQFLLCRFVYHYSCLLYTSRCV